MLALIQETFNVKLSMEIVEKISCQKYIEMVQIFKLIADSATYSH